MKSVKYLDLLMEQRQLKNDVAVCKLLNWSSGQISQYRSGKNIMNNEACLALAIELGIDPAQIIMAADIDRAHKKGQHSLWEVFTARTALTANAALLAIAVLVNLFLTPTPVEAAPVLKQDAVTLGIM